MNKADCVTEYVAPDFVMTLWWILVSVAFIAIIGAIIIAFLNYILEQYQARKEDYLRAKKLKLDMKRIYGVEE